MITLEQMLESGVHFGHQVRRRNPKMAPFIYSERNGIHIIDILQTLVALEEISEFLTDQVSKGKNRFICRNQTSSLSDYWSRSERL